MYRIIFNPQIGKWQIQLNTLMFFWVTVCSVNQDGDKEQMSFANYDQANGTVTQLGLNNVYRDYNQSMIRQLLNSNV